MDKFKLKEKVISKMGMYGLCEPGSDNPILFTAEFYHICKKLKMFDKDDSDRLDKALLFLTESPGLFNRRPKLNTRKEDHDNYVGIVSCSVLSKYARKCLENILWYGEHNFYSYDNTRVNTYSFDCQRQGFDIFLYKVAAGHSPWHWFGINYLWFIGKIFFEFKFKGKEFEHTSSHLLSWLRFLTIGDNKWVKPIKNYWIKKMKKKYGEKWLLTIFRIYFGVYSELSELIEWLNPEDYV